MAFGKATEVTEARTCAIEVVRRYLGRFESSLMAIIECNFKLSCISPSHGPLWMKRKEGCIELPRVDSHVIIHQCTASFHGRRTFTCKQGLLSFIQPAGRQSIIIYPEKLLSTRLAAWSVEIPFCCGCRWFGQLNHPSCPSEFGTLKSSRFSDIQTD